MARKNNARTVTTKLTVRQFCALRDVVAASKGDALKREVTIYEVMDLWRSNDIDIQFIGRGTYSIYGTEGSMKRFFSDCLFHSMGRQSKVVYNALNRIAGAINDPDFIADSGF